MRIQFSRAVAVCVVAFTMPVASAVAQTTSKSSAVASPTYVTLHMEVTVNKSAADVWKEFGGYCAIAAWEKNPCMLTIGKEGELGAMRTLGGGEVIVGRTQYSYTYSKPVKDGEPYDQYHGTLEARPITATSSKLIYEFTVSDPATWTRGWTVNLPMTKSDDRVYEYACHEGNHAMESMLAGARAEEAAELAKKK